MFDVMLFSDVVKNFFFAHRIVRPWNYLPVYIADFST